jgi:hypothetical protein
VAEAEATDEGAGVEVGGVPVGAPGDVDDEGFGVGLSAPQAARNSATPPASADPRNRRRVTTGPA